MRKKAAITLLALAAGAHVWMFLMPYAFELAGKHGAPEIAGSPVDIYAIALYTIFTAVALAALWALRRILGE